MITVALPFCQLPSSTKVLRSICYATCRTSSWDGGRALIYNPILLIWEYRHRASITVSCPGARNWNKVNPEIELNSPSNALFFPRNWTRHQFLTSLLAATPALRTQECWAWPAKVPGTDPGLWHLKPHLRGYSLRKIFQKDECTIRYEWEN